jgi:SAM-dependent methyltransferase
VTTEESLRRSASELRLLFEGRAISTVLDVGCGDGVLYEPLGFAGTRYRGVDFSESMLAHFRLRHPEADLVLADGHSYRNERRYDLIFTNQLVQYLNARMLDQFLGNARAMMGPGSALVCAGVPWRALRFQYLNGELSRVRETSLVAGCKGTVATWLGKGLGHWYSPDSLRRAGARHGFGCVVYGCLEYPYRFHAVLELRED